MLLNDQAQDIRGKGTYHNENEPSVEPHQEGKPCKNSLRPFTIETTKLRTYPGWSALVTIKRLCFLCNLRNGLNSTGGTWDFISAAVLEQCLD